MAESSAFYSQTKDILETAIKCAVDLTAGHEKGGHSATVGFDKILMLLAQEASRKINSIFLQLFDSANKETLTLRDKVNKLEVQLKVTMEDLNTNRVWRENLISGCPVLNEETGWISTLQPLGILVELTDKIAKEDVETIIAGGGHNIAKPDNTTASSDSQNSLQAKVQKKVFECDVCKKSFSRQLYLQRHLDTHKEPLSCHQCPMTFRNNVTLERHLRRHEKKTLQSFACLHCNKIYKSKRVLRSHEAIHDNGTQPLSNDEVSRRKACTCDTCGASFTQPQSLKRHIRLHTGERPYPCDVCGKTFIVQDKLKAHMLLHGATKSFMCDLCGKTFLYNWQLKKHQQMPHQEGTEAGTETGRRRAQANRTVIVKRDRSIVEVAPFACQTCQRGFNSEAALQKHELIHTGGAPYTCDICGKGYLYKPTFDYHIRTHSGERPYACDVCGKTFITRHTLKYHRLMHTGEKPHACKQCGKTFRMYTNYRRHVRIHTGEKPYQCEVCGVRFRQLGHVKFHMQVHTGERPYACATCGLGFSDSRQMKRHSCARNELMTNLLAS
ncbi:zinc finger protein 431-like isoform X2 [Corythoichthys intestinalis]|uniref:zinc finger protein 431-like isoform X2 n=1 Tax=Corythoichthys intestinalis TaxID=161448 RepID=UPI0025A6036C|nr:zinc finger protein 431-like isoform X2 [Corythoichthys intestinalis]